MTIKRTKSDTWGLSSVRITRHTVQLEVQLVLLLNMPSSPVANSYLSFCSASSQTCRCCRCSMHSFNFSFLQQMYCISCITPYLCHCLTYKNRGLTGEWYQYFHLTRYSCLLLHASGSVMYANDRHQTKRVKNVAVKWEFVKSLLWNGRGYNKLRPRDGFGRGVDSFLMASPGQNQSLRWQIES